MSVNVAMSKDVVEWVTKNSKALARCVCGRYCHIDVTIEEFCIRFRVICPHCNRVYTVRENIKAITEAKIDATDSIIEKVKREFRDRNKGVVVKIGE